MSNLDKLVAEILQQAQKEAKALKERVISNANLKSRDMILQAKEELADDILEKVLERLKNIDTKKYLKFVENILKNLNLSKNAEVMVSKDMKLALGDKILDYKISDQTVESGCSIKDGNLIYNNEFSNLIEFNREELEREILNKIFE